METVSAPESWKDALCKVSTIVESLGEDALKTRLDKGSLALPQISGVDDTTYFSVLDKSTKKPAFDILQGVQCSPLPIEVQNHLQQSKSDDMFTASGFIVEHKKAWISIGNCLYFWDYETGQGLACFDAVEQLILDVAVVAKNEEIFGVKENHLLFISTPTMLYLFPLTVNMLASDHDSYEYTTSNEILADVKSEGVSSFVKSKNDKICCKSYDGTLYDVKITSTKGMIIKITLHIMSDSSFVKYFPTVSKLLGWRNPQVKFLFFDDSRNFLYAVDNYDNVKTHVFDADMTKFVSTYTFSRSSIINSIVKVYNDFKEADFGDFIGYSVIDKSYSNHIQLKMFTSTGIRLYFSKSTSKNNSAHLALHHVRFPPIYSQLSTYYVSKAFSIQGVSVMLMNSDIENTSYLISTTDEVFNPQSTINEIHEKIESPLGIQDLSSIWSICEVSSGENSSVSSQLILNDNGVFIISRATKQTIFVNLLSKYGTSAEETLSFVLLTGPVYACMIAIEMIGLYDALSHHIVQFIHSIGQLNGTKGNLSQNNIYPSILESTLCAGVGEQKSFALKNMIQMSNNAKHDDTNLNSPFSTLLTSLYTSVGLLLKPLWLSKIFKTGQASTNVGTKCLLQHSNDIESLQLVHSSLRRIQMFMRDHSRSLFAGNELHSAINLMVFVELLLELLSLFEITYMFPVHRVFPEKLWQDLCSLTFESLFKSHESITSMLIEHMLLYYIENEADINILNTHLTQRCPQLFKESDAMFSRATQSLALASNCVDGKEKYINEAFEIYKSTLSQIDIAQASFNLLKCQAFVEIAKLCFLKARYFEDEADRSRIYNIYIDVLLFLNQLKLNNEIDQSLMKYFENYSKENAASDFLNLIKLGLAVEDKCLHFRIYDFLQSVDERKLFIQINTPYVNDYIANLITNTGEESDLLDEKVACLASEFYESRNMFYEAACMKYHSVNSLKTDLDKKVQTLETIQLLLKAIPESRKTKDVTQFTDQITSDIDACGIQMKVLNRFKQIKCDIENISKELNQKIYSLQDLLIEFVHPFDMFDIKLEIILCSKKKVDDCIVKSIWANLISFELQQLDRSKQSLSLLFDTMKRFCNEPTELFPLTHILLCMLIEIGRFSLDADQIFSTFARECFNISTIDLLLSLKSLTTLSEISVTDLIVAFEVVCNERSRELNFPVQLVEDFIDEIKQYVESKSEKAQRVITKLQQICS